METLILMFNLLIFILYNTTIITKYGIPESLSETTYLLKNKYWIFTLLCFITVFSLLPLWLGICNNHNFDFLKFISMGSLLFVGATPFFKESLQKQVHYTSAIICFFSILLWFILQQLYLYITVCLILFIVSLLFFKSKYVYFAEILIWLAIIIFLFLQFF